LHGGLPDVYMLVEGCALTLQGFGVGIVAAAGGKGEDGSGIINNHKRYSSVTGAPAMLASAVTAVRVHTTTSAN
jgi:hypothetical protein